MLIHQPSSRMHRIGLSSLVVDRLAAGLGHDLDDGYHYLRRITAGDGAPIDAVVVGRGGTWTITLSHERGRFLKRNGHWYRWNASTESWVPWAAETITAARLAGHRLERHLEQVGVPAAVEPLLFVSREMQVECERGERAGVEVEDDLKRLSARIGREERLTAAQVDRIVTLLDPRQPLPRLATSTPRG